MDDAHKTPDPSLTPLFSEFADDPDMVEMIEYFCGEIMNHVSTLDEAFGRRDLEELRVFAHRLKGAAGGYGYPSISDCADVLERLLMDTPDDVDLLAPRVDELITLCKRAAVARPGAPGL